MTGLNGGMAKDTVLYMTAKIIEGAAGIATLSALSHMFKTQQFDIYVLVNITSTTAAMLAIQWLAQSAGRYLNDWELKGNKDTFYSTVFHGWLWVNTLVIAIAILFRLMFKAVTLELYVLAIIFFVTYNSSQLLIALLSVKRKAVTNLFISTFSSVGKLVLIYAFYRIIGARIEIIFISYILCDVMVIVVGFSSLGAYGHIKLKEKSGELLKSFLIYGAPLIGNLVTTTVLNNSDRFVMKYYLREGDVGIYSANYSVVSAAFAMLIAALMRGSYPTILKTHAKGDKEMTEKLVSEAARNFLLLSVPAAAGIGVLAKPLAELVLDKSYAGGYTVMIWVALGMLFLGLAEYSNKPWELSAQTGYIFRYSLIGGLVNIGLNIALIPKFGYMTAAYSTFIGYFVCFCLSRLGSRKLMKWRIRLKTYISIIASSCLMSGAIYLLMGLLGKSKALLFVYVAAGVLIYGVILAFTGEITGELKGLIKLIKSGRRK